jgi:hypothetical protein
MQAVPCTRLKRPESSSEASPVTASMPYYEPVNSRVSSSDAAGSSLGRRSQLSSTNLPRLSVHPRTLLGLDGPFKDRWNSSRPSPSGRPLGSRQASKLPAFSVCDS